MYLKMQLSFKAIRWTRLESFDYGPRTLCLTHLNQTLRSKLQPSFHVKHLGRMESNNKKGAGLRGPLKDLLCSCVFSPLHKSEAAPHLQPIGLMSPQLKSSRGLFAVSAITRLCAVQMVYDLWYSRRQTRECCAPIGPDASNDSARSLYRMSAWM